MNIRQRAAFARAAEEQKQKARKNNKKTTKKAKPKMKPVSRKGKSKFRY